MITAFLLAAGQSVRFAKSSGGDKLFLPLRGKPVLQYSFETLIKHPLIRNIVVIVNKKNIKKVKMLISTVKTGKSVAIIFGGKSRQASVARGITKGIKLLMRAAHDMHRAAKPRFILIHNAANPFINDEEIYSCAHVLQRYRIFDGVAVGHPVDATVKETVSPALSQYHIPHAFAPVRHTLDRNFLWRMETPQIVRLLPFLEAHRKAKKEKFEATDDLSLLERLGRKTAVIPASKNNFKITAPLDYELAKTVVGDFPQNISVGMAEDAHLLSRKHKGLHLAGAFFRDFPKTEADSDGDIALHAISSAISQALGKNSLGAFAKPLFKKGIRESSAYLEKILAEMKKQKLGIRHLGLHFEGKNPHIDAISPMLRIALSRLLNLSPKKIGITAETGERKKTDRKLRCIATVTLAR